FIGAHWGLKESRWRRLCPFVGALLLVALTGCSPGYGDLAGSVRYRGKPVTVGEVTVFGGDERPSRVSIQPDGTYAIKGIVVGNITITVASFEPKPLNVLVNGLSEKPEALKDAMPEQEIKERSKMVGPRTKMEAWKDPDYDRKVKEWFPIPNRYL